MGRLITFGLGGYDTTKPNNNIVADETFADPEPTPEEIIKQQAIKKLKVLGLTEEEIFALIK